MTIQPHERILLAYDRSTFDLTELEFLQKLAPHVGGIKLGLETMTAPSGPGDRTPIAFRMLHYLARMNMKVMWDGKYKDIPNTVGKAVRNMSFDGVWGQTMHPDAGLKVTKAAVENRGNSLIIGVTVLTSMEEAECDKYFGRIPKMQACFLAGELLKAQAQAVVSSPLELEVINKAAGDRLFKITPGIRDKDAPPDDQNRTMPAYDAIHAGADYLVVGRPILAASDSVAAAKRFGDEIARACGSRSMV